MMQGLEIHQLDIQTDEHSNAACLSSSNGVGCVATNLGLTVLSDGLKRVESVFTTDETVDAVALCSDGSLLAAGLRNGHLLLFDAKQGTVVDKDLTGESSGTFSYLEFAPPESGEVGIGRLLILWSRGTVCLLSERLSPLQCLNKEDEWEPQVVQLRTAGIAFATFFANGQKLLCSEKEATLSVWGCSAEGFERVDHISLVLQVVAPSTCAGVTVEKAAFTGDESLLVTSQENGTIAVWSTLLLVVINLYQIKGNLKDFVLWEIVNSNSPAAITSPPTSEGVLLCALVEAEVDKELLLMTLPNFETTNVISVAMGTRLLSGSSAVGTLCYTEEEKGSGKVCIKEVIETRDKDRLDSLINSHRYEEAERFAEEHNLDKEDIYQSKAAFLLSECVARDGLITAVLQCLERVTDVPFIVELCSSAALQDCTSVAALLQYSVKRIETVPKEEEATKPSLRVKVQGMLHRLASFSLILGTQDFNANLWHHFKSARLPDIVQLLLSEGKLSEASTVWLQHQGDLLKELNTERVAVLLACVPEGVPMEEVSVFSETIASFLIHHLPEPLDHFVDWFAEKVNSCVVDGEGAALEECLTSTRSLLVLFRSAVRQRGRHPIMPAAHSNSETFVNLGAVKKLDGLVSTLEELSYLLHKLCLTDISLEQIAESREDLVWLLLDRVIAPENFPQVVEDQISLYCRRHQMDLDQTLVRYVKYFLSRVPVQTRCEVDCLEELPWETRILSLIACIKAEGPHLEVVCELVKHSRIPWSPEVESLVRKARQSQLPKVEDLERHCQFVQLKSIAHMYNFSPAELEYLPTHKPIGIVRKIMRSGAASSLTDALKVVNMCKVTVVEVYVTYVKFLAKNGKVDEVEALLPTLPHPTALEVARRMVTEGMVGCSPLCTQLGSIGARFLTSQDQQTVLEGTEWSHVPLSEVVSVFERMQLLQRKYSESPLFSSLMDEGYCKQQVQQKMASLQSSATKKDVDKLLRFAQLYGVSSEWVLCELLLKGVKEKQFEAAALLCRSLQDCEELPSQVDHVRSVVEALWRVLAHSPSTVLPAPLSPLLKAMADLAARLLACCDSEELLFLQELAHAVRYMVDMDQQCSTFIDEHSNQRLSLTLRKEVLEPVFQEEVLMMQQSLALPQVAQFHLAGTVFTSAGLVVDEFVKTSGCLAAVLKENGLNQLALDCAQETLHTIHLHCLLSGEDLTPLEAKGSDFIKSLVTTLAETVMRSPKLDHLYSLALLVSLPSSQVLQLLVASRKSCKGYSKMMVFSDLCIHLGTLLGSRDVISAASHFYRIAKWGKILREYKIDFSGALKGDRHQVELSTLEEMMQRRDIPLHLMIDYSRDTEQPLAAVLPRYLLNVLVKWSEGYQQRALVLLRRLSPLEARECLMKAQAKACSYDYERLEFILEQLDAMAGLVEVDIMAKNLALLRWMKVHQRQSRPSEYEAEFYAHCRGAEDTDTANISLPPLSSTRLPYHALVCGNARKIINPELTLSSMESLLKVTPLLSIPKDEVLILTLKNATQLFCTEETSSQCAEQSARLGGIFDRIEDAQLAVACGQWMKNKLRGESQICILEKTAAVAQRWLSSAGTEKEREKASEAVEELLHEVRTSSVQYALERNNLALERTLELIEQPEELIVFLYTEETVAAPPSIPTDDNVPAAVAVKVHEAAREIAAVCQLDLQSIQKHLLNVWLQSASSRKTTQCPLDATLDTTQLSLDETLPLSGANRGDSSASKQEDEGYFQRLVYLMSEEGRIEENVCTLLNYAKRSTSVFPYKARGLALRVALHIAPPEVVQRVSNKTMKEVIDYCQVLHIMSELEVLGVPVDMQSYLSYDKVALIRGLLKSHSHQPKALDLTVDVMAFHSLLDPPLWDQVLGRLMDLKLVNTLRRALVYLAKASPSDCLVPTAVDAWTFLLKQPLKEAEAPVIGHQKDVLLDFFKLLFECPCLFSLDLHFFVRSYHRLELPALALACVCLLPSTQEREAFVKSLAKLLGSQGWEDVERELQRLPLPPHIRAAVTQEMHALKVV